jgi:hypothetical protein
VAPYLLNSFHVHINIINKYALSEIKMDAKQKFCVDSVLNGQNVLLVGQAGANGFVVTIVKKTIPVLYSL